MSAIYPLHLVYSLRSMTHPRCIQIRYARIYYIIYLFFFERREYKLFTIIAVWSVGSFIWSVIVIKRREIKLLLVFSSSINNDAVVRPIEVNFPTSKWLILMEIWNPSGHSQVQYWRCEIVNDQQQKRRCHQRNLVPSPQNINDI